MNNPVSNSKKTKNKTLLLVEGHHEKNKLLKILLNIFSRLPISIENIYIYDTNIYELNKLIEEEYDEDWYETDTSIDIPLLISRRHNIVPALDSRDFTNIILMFDYERQDTNYSEETIVHLQEHFSKYSSDGTLYLNYPMVESYQHFLSIPDEGFQTRTVPVSQLWDGGYKALVDKESKIKKYLNFYLKTYDILQGFLPSYPEEHLERVIFKLLSINSLNDLPEKASAILEETSMVEEKRNTFIKNFYYSVRRLGYIEDNNSFWSKYGEVLRYVALECIRKSLKLQYSTTISDDEKYLHEEYENIDLKDILEKQNINSRDTQMGFVAVLNTCITFLGEYSFFWEHDNR